MEDDVADVGGVADDGEDDVGGGGDGGGSGGPLGPQLEEGISFGLGSGEDGEIEARFEEMGAHGLAHYARADPAQTGG